jgi:hypothetical protein
MLFGAYIFLTFSSLWIILFYKTSFLMLWKACCPQINLFKVFLPFFYGTGIWTFWPLYQPLFVLGFFEIRSQELFVHVWLQTMVLLTSASWVGRFTGVSHWHPAIYFFVCLAYTGVLFLALFSNSDLFEHFLLYNMELPYGLCSNLRLYR